MLSLPAGGVFSPRVVTLRTLLIDMGLWVGTSPSLAAVFAAPASTSASLALSQAVLAGQLQQLSSSVPKAWRTGYCRRHFQTLVENSPLLGQPNVAGPFGNAGEVPLWLEVLSDAKILGPFLKLRVDNLLGCLLLHDSWGQGHLLSPELVFPSAS